LSRADIIAAGTLFRASQFLAEELPIRLAHRVEELETLPDGLNDMPSVQKVKEWYAQSFEVRLRNAHVLLLAMPRLTPGPIVGNHPAAPTETRQGHKGTTHEAGQIWLARLLTAVRINAEPIH
jgi:hypothetical protein